MTKRSVAQPLRPGLAVGVALVSAALLGSELTLTRLLSVVLWYHFAFFAISVALFGLGLAALAVHYFADRLRDVPRALAAGALATALSLVVVDVAFVNVTPDWFGGALGVFTVLTFKLLGMFLLSAVPFFFGGVVISLALSHYALQASRLYFWDLIGAAAGALALLELAAVLSGPALLLVFAALAAAGGIGFLVGRAAGERGLLVALAVAIALPLGLSATRVVDLRVAKGVDLQRVPPEFTRWNAFSLVTVLPASDFKGWGIAPRYHGSIPPQKTLVIDMNAMTPLIAFDGDFSKVDYVTHDLSAFVYRTRDDWSKVCIIGAGGGKDVLAALSRGADQVTAVEVNPIIARDVMGGRYREMVGDLYGRRDVHLQVEDGRSFARRSDERFDVVHLSMVDTSAASAAGAYALSENALYTAEAFRDFFGALAPRGVLSVASVSLPDLWVGTRLATTLRAALGGGAIGDRVVVLETPWLGVREARLYDFLVAPDGFSADTLLRTRAAAEALGFNVVYMPGHATNPTNPEHALVRRVIQERDEVALTAFLAGLPLDVTATHDDRPFFFYQNRLRDLPLALLLPTPLHLFGNGLVLLSKVFALSCIFALVLMLLPRWYSRGRDTPLRSSEVGFATCLGIGFLLAELGILHRVSPYLGKPTLSLSVVVVAVLAGGALGSRLLSRRSARSVQGLMALLVVALLAAAWTLPLLTDATRSWSPTMRGLCVGAVVFAVGLLLGVPMPAALRAIARRAPDATAWFWAINGGTSVLGTVLATLVALHFGATATVLSAAALYALATLLSRAVLGSESGEPTESGEPS
ncbi:MAG: class I SAM-dependent methyltransferase [Polyangiaceae bacterium]